MRASLREAFILLRFPNSVLLLPVALLAFALSPDAFTFPIGVFFLSLHALLFPASHGVNSSWDRDTGAISLVRNPPVPPKYLWWVSFGMEVVGLAMVAALSWTSAGLLAACVSASHLYSYPITRLKARGWLEWVWVSFFQGTMVFFAAAEIMGPRDLFWGGLTAFALIGASHPIAQIYQHHEDGLKGDVTLSLALGVRGTLMFAAIGDAILGLLLLKLFPNATWWSWLTFVPVAFFGARDRNKSTFEYAKKQALAGAFGMIGFLLLQKLAG